MSKTARTLAASTFTATVMLVSLTGCAAASRTPVSTPSAHLSSGSADSSISATITPASVLQTWMADIIGGDDLGACLKTAGPRSTTDSTLVPATAERCSTPETGNLGPSTPEQLLGRLRTALTPTGFTGQATVAVKSAAPTGGTQSVDATEITVNGQPLSQIMLWHSSGLTADQLHVSFDLAEVSGTWYVTNFNLNA